MALEIRDRATLISKAGECVYGMVIGLTYPEIDELYADASVAAYRPEAEIAVLEDGIWFRPPALIYLKMPSRAIRIPSMRPSCGPSPNGWGYP
jgi:hypothetical protein